MEQLPFNPTDGAVVLILVISGLIALVRGFVHEVLGLFAWIGAGVATYYGIDYVIPIARDMVENQALADIGAGVVLFLIVLVFLSLATKIIADKIRDSSLGTLDRSVGLLFGLVRGIVVICAAWIVIVMVVPKKEMPPWLTEARTLPLIETGAARLRALIPEHLLPEKAPELDQTLDLGTQGISRILVPPAKEPVQEDATGYNDAERTGMDRLHESVE
ncbi:MAG: CvpA family protein [Pseudomonadota bacterium]